MQNDYWMNRRTIRRYTSRTIPTELLNELLLKASHAPTTGNMQLYSVVISTSEEDKAALAPAHFNQPQVKTQQQSSRSAPTSTASANGANADRLSPATTTCSRL